MSGHDAVAIVGIGCRFPGGASTPAAFWELLEQGTDAIVDVPRDRWSVRRYYDPDPTRPGAKMYVKQGGFLRENIYEFDARFFGMAPREASALDPQQRLLLEVTWEAFEDAGLTAEQLAGSATGVYVGGFTLDHKLQQFSFFNRDAITTHTATSATMVMLSNRISYVFDLRGPSMTVDTACSSSLVALHLACQALRTGECELAVCGGVNVMFRPEYAVGMCRGGFLSPDGRCKTFDASANGYGRGEGAGVVILKPLRRALEDGDRVYACVAATGVNQDGHTNGITLPNGEAQQRLMRRVCRQAGIAPNQIAYVEAHGTGTRAGDPVEANSLGAVLSQERPADEPCWVGSVKTNIGHLEAAAGIAGLIKTALILKKKTVPPNVHFVTPNPKIDLDALGLRVPQRPEPLPSRRLYAAINSFGYGGTNAHAIAQEPPPQDVRVSHARARPLVIPISAHTPEALRSAAQNYLQVADALDDLAYTAAVRRTHHLYRLAVVADSPAAFQHHVRAYLAGEAVPGVVEGRVYARESKKTAFIYTGMGAQSWGMGAELLQREPVFRAAIEACDRIWQQYASWSLVEMLGEGDGRPMREPRYAQPLNFALQVGLTALWNAVGVRPDAVIGHSVGEIAAAYTANTLSLEDALRLTYHRSHVQQRVAGEGAMMAVGLAEQEILPLIAERPISLAAVNSPGAVTLAGDKAALTALAGALAEQGVYTQLLQVDVAYHSYQMDPLEADFVAALSDLSPAAPALPLYSTVSGERIRSADHDVTYWWRNARQTVRFADALARMIADGYDTFVEIGPHPVLAASIRECVPQSVAIPSLRRKAPEVETLLTSLATLYTAGARIDWRTLYPRGNLLSLPTYPWQRELLWYESAESRADRLGIDGHPLAQPQPDAAQPTWEGDLSSHWLPYLADHQIDGMAIFPGAGYVELGLMLGASVVEDLQFHRAIAVDTTPIIQVKLDAASGHFSVHSRSAERGSGWSLNAEGRILKDTLGRRCAQVDLRAVRGRCTGVIAREALYRRFDEHKMHYGAHFQGIRCIGTGADEFLAEIETPADDLEQYALHPTLLDSCFQGMLTVADIADRIYLPVRIRQVRVHRKPARARLWCHGRRTKQTPHMVEGDLVLCDDDGDVIAEVFGLRLQALGEAPRQAQTHNLYEMRWEESSETLIPLDGETHWLVFADRAGVAAQLAEALRSHHAHCIQVVKGGAFDRIDARCFQINPESAEDMAIVLNAAHPLTGIVYAWGIDAADETGLADSLPLLPLVQTLAARSLRKLAILTRAAQQVTNDEPVADAGQWTLWGLGRVIANEHRALNATLIDLDAHDAAASLALEVVSASAESEIALRGGKRYVARLGAAGDLTQVITATPATHYGLMHGATGTMAGLAFHEIARRAPGPGEIEVEVHAAAVNFKDIMKALNLLPTAYLDATFFGDALGLESSGVVVDMGEGVERFRVGDKVVFFDANGSFRSHSTVPAALAMPLVPHLSFEESVCYINFITAYYGLCTLGRMRRGERVLIHGATGGVGLAAIQLAQWVGAEIYATASTPEKRAYLHTLGVQHVSDSRSLRFVDDVLEWTNGVGVDLVLNSLPGEALAKSFTLLKSFGRFIEIGKRDISEDNGLAMATFDRNITFAALDLDRMLADDPDLFCRLWAEVWELFSAGTLAPLPIRTYPATQVAEAFQFMAQARHIGKIVVQMHRQPVPVRRAPRGDVVRPDATYLITGGFGGFGLETARWLVERGARHLALVGRTGASTPEARAALEAFRAARVDVLALAADLSDEAAAAGVMRRIAATMPPLRGVIHAAMVLRDGMLIDTDRERFEQVMRPKALGAWHLHTLTRDMPLDFFVTYSSVSALFGNPGQGNYAAANAFLDGLARYRRAQGLAGMSVNWGAIADAGVLARNPDVARHLSLMGIQAIPAAQALDLLGTLLLYDPPQAAVVDADWRQLATILGGASPRYGPVAGARQDGGADPESFADVLRNAPPEQRQSMAEEALIEQIAGVLRLAASRIDTQTGLAQLGVDSLMAMELRNAIRVRTGVEFSTMMMMQNPTVAQLAAHVLATLIQPEHDVEELSEEELDALLLRLLADEKLTL